MIVRWARMALPVAGVSANRCFFEANSKNLVNFVVQDDSLCQRIDAPSMRRACALMRRGDQTNPSDRSPSQRTACKQAV